MADREKVIAALEKACRDSVELPPFAGRIEITKEAVEEGILPLLREQEPVEPDAILINPVCGVCHEPLDVTDEYCRHCGRAVKWRV